MWSYHLPPSSMQIKNNDSRWPKLPEKVPGKHRWTGVVGVTLTDGQVRQFLRGNIISVTERNVLGFQEPGCVDCDLRASEAPEVCEGEEWVPGSSN